MNEETKTTIAVLTVIAVLFLGTFAGISLYSGFSPPFSTVTSQSMQHEDGRSGIGVIDTGDMVLVRNKSKTEIVSYLEGRTTGFSKFGDYGSVIIYNRGDGRNPVIHRAIIDAEIVSDGTNKGLKAHFLEYYKDENGDPMWNCTMSTDPNFLRGMLTLKKMGYNKKDLVINIDSILIKETEGTRGYVTKGDNNIHIDQPGISGLVTYEEIRSVPAAEIPWIGCIKLITSGRSSAVNENVPNSLPALGAVIVSIVFSLIFLYLLYFGFEIEKRYKKSDKKE